MISSKPWPAALGAAVILGATLVGGAPTTAAAPSADSALVTAIAGTTRSTPWVLARRLRLTFPTFHPQGFARVGNRLFLSSVEIIERPVRYPEPVGGYDRSPGQGRGHVFVLDLAGNLLRDIVLAEGDMYHPGGIDADGRSLWVPVAEYRPNSRAIVYRIDLATLAVSTAFRVDDHIGGVVADPGTGRVHGVSWGSRTFYAWTRQGRLVDRRPNPSHFIDYQDCAYTGRRMMACTGITEYANAAGARFELGGIALVDLRSSTVRHEVPFQHYSAAGHVATRNPVHLEVSGATLRLWAAPDDGEEINGTEILVYEAALPRSVALRAQQRADAPPPHAILVP
ncbi:MAG TPA: DUF6454 family protein [Pilimelia sp.]|nr:DUF6454 family protein [Pilimelia sp.]